MITLLIPTKNRSEFLNKTLGYYADHNFGGLIFIGDSSDKGHVDKINETMNKLKGKLNIKYKWYPQELNFTQCFNLMLKEITTPYAALIGDDDFLVPAGIERCLKFLDSNMEYIGAHGVGARILVERGEACLKVNQISDYVLASREEETASKRLLNHMGRMSNMVFSVYRTPILQGMFEHIEIPDHSIAGDLLPGCMAVVKGKIKRLGCFYIVHLVHAGQNQAYHDIFDWLTNPNWLQSYQMFRQILSDELSKADNIDIDKAYPVVKRAFWSYLKYKLNNHYKTVYGSPEIKQRLKRKIPFLKKILDKGREIKYKIAPAKAVNAHTLLNPRSPYHADFMPVYRAVTEDFQSGRFL